MKRRRRQNTEDSPPYIHSSRNSHTYSYPHNSHMCSYPCNSHTYSYNLLLRNRAQNRHSFRDRDIRNEVPTLFPRSRHPERGAVSAAEPSCARTNAQSGRAFQTGVPESTNEPSKRRKQTNPKTFQMPRLNPSEGQDLCCDSIPLLPLSSREAYSRGPGLWGLS